MEESKVLKKDDGFLLRIDIIKGDFGIHIEINKFRNCEIQIYTFSCEEIEEDVNRFFNHYKDGDFSSEILWKIALLELGLIEKKYNTSLYCVEQLVQTFEALENIAKRDRNG